MKKIGISLFLITCFTIFLLFPKTTLQGAQNGLLLWFRSILPSLFPFAVLSNLLLATNSVSYISQIFSPIFGKLFRVSGNGCFAILAGFLCGYPMGAKVTSDLAIKKFISKEEACYLLSFCNNTSPMFIVSYVILQSLKREDLLVGSVCILFLSPILCSFLFRLYYQPSIQYNIYSKKNICFHSSMLDEAIINGMETLTKVGSYMILFGILLEFTSISSLEITGGISCILKNNRSFYHAYVPVMALTSFGGWCSVMQTQSMVQKANLPIFPYIIEKLITAMVTSLMSYCYLQYIIQC